MWLQVVRENWVALVVAQVVVMALMLHFIQVSLTFMGWSSKLKVVQKHGCLHTQNIIAATIPP